MIDENDVRAIDKARREAMIRADVGQLLELFADDMMLIHANARVDTRAGLLKRSGRARPSTSPSTATTRRSASSTTWRLSAVSRS